MSEGPSAATESDAKAKLTWGFQVILFCSWSNYAQFDYPQRRITIEIFFSFSVFRGFSGFSAKNDYYYRILGLISSILINVSKFPGVLGA